MGERGSRSTIVTSSYSWITPKLVGIGDDLTDST